jgi:hypothetical protein
VIKDSGLVSWRFSQLPFHEAPIFSKPMEVSMLSFKKLQDMRKCSEGMYVFYWILYKRF